MHLAPGLFDNFDKLEIPYSTTRTIDFHMRIRTHACAMLEDHTTITNNHEYKKDTSNIKFSLTIHTYKHINLFLKHDNPWI